MKRRLICFLGLCCLLFNLAAADFVVSGYGISSEEARDAALSEMSSYLNLEISTNFSSHVFDDGEKYSSIFEESFILDSKSSLIGVEFSNPIKIKDGRWKVDAIISEDKIPVYEDRANRLSSFLRSAVFNGFEDPLLLITYYNDLLFALEDYDSTCLILAKLGSSMLRESFDIDTLFIKNEIRRLASENISQLNNYIRMLNAKVELSEEELDILKEKEQALLDIEKLLHEDEQRLKKEQVQLYDELDAIGKSYLKNLNSINMNLVDIDYTDPFEYVLDLEQNRNSFTTIKMDLKIALDNLYDEFHVKAIEKINSILFRPYRKLEMDENGNPQKFYQEARVAEAESEVDELYDIYYKKAKVMYSDGIDKLGSIKDKSETLIKRLSEQRYVISTQNRSVTAAIKEFDPLKGAWTGYVYFYIGDNEVVIPFEILYEDWTGNKKPQKGDLDWDRYIAICDHWHDIFKTYPNSFEIEMTYSLEGNLHDNDYVLSITSLVIKNPVEQGHIVKEYKDCISNKIRLGDNVVDLEVLNFSNLFDLEKCSEEFDVNPDIYRDIKNITVIQYDLNRTKRFGTYIGTENKLNSDIFTSEFDFGLTYAGVKPVFYNTRLNINVGGYYMIDSREYIHNLGVAIGLGFYSYLDSYSFIDWGIDTDIGFSLNNKNLYSVEPDLYLGFGVDTPMGTLKGEVMLAFVIPLNSLYEFNCAFGSRFSWIYLFM